MRCFTLALTIAWMSLASNRSSAQEFDRVLASFGNLSTVAGTANMDGGGVNGWNINMEGGLAVSAELSRPHMTTADLAGNLYVADKDAHAIRLITPAGTIHTIAGTNVSGFNGDGVATTAQLSAPNGIFTFSDGSSYILDLNNSMIRKWTTDGQLQTVFQDPFGISAGRGLWVSAEEDLIYYSSGTQLKQWTPTGGIVTVANGFTNLGNLTVDPLDGNLVVTDRGIRDTNDGSGHTVIKVLPDGSKLRIAGSGATAGGGDGNSALLTGLHEVRAISYDTTGGFYVGTHRGSDVWYVDTAGTIHLLVEGDTSNDTHGGDGALLSTTGLKISEPRSVVVGPNRELLITENDGGYVRRVERVLNTPGDFDYDGQLTASDIDLLTLVTRHKSHAGIFNLDPAISRFVDEEDRRILVEDLLSTSFGDANLDGFVNAADYQTIANNLFTFDTTWSSGDFNGDGRTDVQDFNILNDNRSAGVPAFAIPEPAGSQLLWFGALIFVLPGWRSAPAGYRPFCSSP